MACIKLLHDSSNGSIYGLLEFQMGEITLENTRLLKNRSLRIFEVLNLSSVFGSSPSMFKSQIALQLGKC